MGINSGFKKHINGQDQNQIKENFEYEFETFELGTVQIIEEKDFTIDIPEGYKALRNTDGKEIIAFKPVDGDDYIQSPLHIMISREPLPLANGISEDNFGMLMESTYRKLDTSCNTKTLTINGVVAVVFQTGAAIGHGQIYLVSIYNGTEYYQLRITFNQPFNNMNYISEVIYNSFRKTEKAMNSNDEKQYEDEECNDDGEIVDFIPLATIIKEDFEGRGRIIRGITHYLAQNIEQYKDSIGDLRTKNEVSNTLFLDLVNIVDFAEYSNSIIAAASINGILIKGLYLKTINYCLSEVKEKKVDIKVIVNKYTTILNNMMRFIFSKETNFNNNELIEALGIYGEDNKTNILKIIKTKTYSKKGDKLVNKLKYIATIISESMNLNDISKPLVNGRFNGLFLLHYLSNNAFFYTESQIDYDGEKHQFTGVEFNSERIWLFPEILLDFDGFAASMIELGDYVEENINLNISLDDLGEDLHDLFKYEDVTGISLINLFTSEYVKFKIISEDYYLIHVDEYIKDNFKEYEKYLTELFRTLIGYNGRSLNSVKFIFKEDVEDVFNSEENSDDIEKNVLKIKYENLEFGDFRFNIPEGYDASGWTSPDGVGGFVIYDQKISDNYKDSPIYITGVPVEDSNLFSVVRNYIVENSNKNGYTFETFDVGDLFATFYHWNKNEYHAYIMYSDVDALKLEIYFDECYENRLDISYNIIKSYKNS